MYYGRYRSFTNDRVLLKSQYENFFYYVVENFEEMDNNNTHIEDLLMDENFIRWVKHPSNDCNLYWKAWLEAHPERKSDVLLAKEMIIGTVFQHKEPSQEAYTEVLHRVMKTTNTRKQFWDFRVRAAASLVLLALASALMMLWQYEPMVPQQHASAPAWVSKQNPAGMKSQLQLPDGTMVWLNAESTLKYPTTFDTTIRQVELIGEAFFDVAKDMQRPFTVQSGNLRTTALGTSFNVSSYPEDASIEVSLVAGKVVIGKKEAGAQKEFLLKPGEQLIYKEHEHSITKTHFDYNTSLGWKDGLLVFKEADIMEIKRKLERWYGVQIEIRGAPEQAWKMTGIFKNQSLERVLERLSFSKKFIFHLSGKNVLIVFSHQKMS